MVTHPFNMLTNFQQLLLLQHTRNPCWSLWWMGSPKNKYCLSKLRIQWGLGEFLSVISESSTFQHCPWTVIIIRWMFVSAEVYSGSNCYSVLQTISGIADKCQLHASFQEILLLYNSVHTTIVFILYFFIWSLQKCVPPTSVVASCVFFTKILCLIKQMFHLMENNNLKVLHFLLIVTFSDTFTVPSKPKWTNSAPPCIWMNEKLDCW